MVRVRQYNKRFFTIDFDAKIFTYSHSESSKKASTEIPFSEILDVRIPEKADQMPVERSSSLLKRATSFGSNTGGKEPEDNVVVVMTKPARAMELLCSTQAEAQQWLQAFEAAMALGPGTDGAAQTRAPQVPAPGGYPASAPTLGGAALTGCTTFDGTGGHPGVATDSSDADSPHRGSASKGKAGTFLDLSVEPEAGALPGGGLGNIVEEAAAVIEASPGGLQAKDFGLDEDEESSDSDASDPEDVMGVAALQGIGGQDGQITADRKSVV